MVETSQKRWWSKAVAVFFLLGCATEKAPELPGPFGLQRAVAAAPVPSGLPGPRGAEIARIKEKNAADVELVKGEWFLSVPDPPEYSGPIPRSNGIKQDHWTMRLKIHNSRIPAAWRLPYHRARGRVPDQVLDTPLSMYELKEMARLGLLLSTVDYRELPVPTPETSFGVGSLVGGWRHGRWIDDVKKHDGSWVSVETNWDMGEIVR